MLNLLDLLSLMRLGAEDFIRDSEQLSATSAPSAVPSIPSRRPVPNGRQTSWHTEYRQRPNQEVHGGNHSCQGMPLFRTPISLEP